ncbi:Uncharacterized protein BP5553_03310 [Venustampulla echinocandica]|uniref:Ribosomal RNA-processing protein 7 n=1 Tax=Venustampulla echinocandica TaxID=2656787 RepID=A0A370TTY2_9HELO|nr:Uncharacterized protein BP5553_03310 [Venustampulla echinocandica]RDL38970.1 Uncharacterized protein BP5553_03310 [Venustampulla echinocandica]
MISTIKDYTILPLILPQTPSFPVQATHTLYLRPHAPKIPTEADERSLFLVNIPIDTTPTHLRAVFASVLGGAGRVEDVFIEGEKGVQQSSTLAIAPPNAGGSRKRKRGNDEDDADASEYPLPDLWDRTLHRSGSTAVVVLVDNKSVEAVLKSIRKLHKSGKQGRFPVWGAGLEDKLAALGSARYEAHHALRYPDPTSLQANVDAFMTAFNAREESKRREDARKRSGPDEEGFVTVTRGGRAGPARRGEAEEKRKEMEEREEKKRREMETGGFYRFQVRERRKKEQGELVRRFEEDKRRVEKLREGKGKRGLRPES